MGSPLDSLATELLEASVMELLSATESVSDTALLEELALDTASSATELESVMASLVEPALAWVECTTATLATTALLSSTQLFLDKFIHSPAPVISILSNEINIYFGKKKKKKKKKKFPRFYPPLKKKKKKKKKK